MKAICLCMKHHSSFGLAMLPMCMRLLKRGECIIQEAHKVKEWAELREQPIYKRRDAILWDPPDSSFAGSWFRMCARPQFGRMQSCFFGQKNTFVLSIVLTISHRSLAPNTNPHMHVHYVSWHNIAICPSSSKTQLQSLTFPMLHLQL